MKERPKTSPELERALDAIMKMDGTMTTAASGEGATGVRSSEKCCETVFHPNGVWRGVRCSKNATVQRNDKPYCTIHDPERVEQKRAENKAKHAAKYAEEMMVWRMERAAPDMLEALRQMLVNSEADGKGYRDCHKKAAAAIAKATGTTPANRDAEPQDTTGEVPK